MPTLSEYFRTEAREFLATLDRIVAGGRPDPAALHRATRGLRGSAQMAREERFFRAVSAFENVTRSLAGGALDWSEDMTERARATIADLREMLNEADPDAAGARESSIAQRWQGGAAAAPGAPAASNGSDAFRQFAAREVADIAAVLEESITALQTDPMDRESLRAVLRRQRALLGAARLDEIPVVAEILRAVEDLTRVIVKLDVGVKREWLDIYRVARDGLQATIATLLRNEDPEPTHAVSRLRHMRAELLERYGEGESVSAAHDAGLVQAQIIPAAPVAEPAPADPPVSDVTAAPDTPGLAIATDDDIADETDDVLELDDAAIVADDDVLELDDAAIIEQQDDGAELAMLELESSQIVERDEDVSPLRRAEELRAIIAHGIGNDDNARAALDELMDLVRRTLE